jgi:hypothetical protein
VTKRIYVPTQSFEDWKRLLAKPDLHWKAGYRSRRLSRCFSSSRLVLVAGIKIAQSMLSSTLASLNIGMGWSCDEFSL